MLKFMYKISSLFSRSFIKLYFKVNNIVFDKGLILNDFLDLTVQGLFLVGKNFKINNRLHSNPIGRNYKCLFVVRKDAKLQIGNNCGFSGVAIVCQKSIEIGDNVKIGTNTCIYDTDFHSLNKDLRRNAKLDIENINKKDVVIGNDVFIGAHSTILKGVRIGNNTIVGACSVVTKDIPDNEMWAGNPAKFIKEIK